MSRSQKLFPFFFLLRLALPFLVGIFFLTPFLQSAQAAAPKTAPPSLNTPLSSTEAQKLLNLFNNPKERDNFTRTLSLVARSGITTKNNSSSDTHILPDINAGLISLRAQTLHVLNDFFGLFQNLRFVGIEAHKQFNNPKLRSTIIDTLLKTTVLFVLGLLLERLISWFIRRPIRHISGQAQQRDVIKQKSSSDYPSSSDDNEKTEELRAADQRRQAETIRFLARIPYACAFFALKLLPIALFYALAWAAFIFLPWTQPGANILMTFANVYVGTRCIILCIETVLSPYSSTIRLLPVHNTTANLLSKWLKYIISIPALIVILASFGVFNFILVPNGADALVRIIVLIEHILIAAFIFRIRHIVSNFLTPKQTNHTLSFWGVIAAITRLWWIPAIFLDISLWGVWAARLPGGYRWILITTGATIAVLIAFRIIAILTYGAQNSFFRLSPLLIKRFPDIQKRADFYYPFARKILSCILISLTTVTIAEIWGLPSYEFFFHNPLGQHIISTILIIIAAIMIAVMIWEVMNILLLQQLARFEQMGMTSRATRLKTVLPIIRTFMLALIIIIVTVTTLSQMGVNVTPLLTGAGILGAAIAFGSQSLVKDFITGFFMLVEDAIQVGDWVKAGGVTGTVENLSIRTVRIRDTFGDLHIIPFSSVTSITNSARGFNKIIIKQQLDLSEDLQRVVAIMEDIVKEMRDDETFSTLIQSDYTDLGVDESSRFGATVMGSILTSPMMTGKVKREFNRRITKRFVEAGVRFYRDTSYIASQPHEPLHVANDIKPSTPSDPI